MPGMDFCIGACNLQHPRAVVSRCVPGAMLATLVRCDARVWQAAPRTVKAQERLYPCVASPAALCVCVCGGGVWWGGGGGMGGCPPGVPAPSGSPTGPGAVMGNGGSGSCDYGLIEHFENRARARARMTSYVGCELRVACGMGAERQRQARQPRPAAAASTPLAGFRKAATPLARAQRGETRRTTRRPPTQMCANTTG
jgi:hypothetical protein